MGFLKSLGKAFQNENSVKTSENKFLEAKYYTNALKNIELNSKAFDEQQVSNTVQSPINGVLIDDFLALNHPAKFIAKYLNKDVIENALKFNPNIKSILNQAGLDVSYNLENVSTIILSHLIPTAKKAQEIYLRLGNNKEDKNYINLTKAALLHDIGKAFIPSEILNKKGKLNSKEREIIELHNKLSYEILKTTPIGHDVAKLALEHHDYDKNLKRTQENQVLAVADIYCALKENRPYKKPLNEVTTRMIMYDMGTSGKFDTKYVSYIN